MLILTEVEAMSFPRDTPTLYRFSKEPDAKLYGPRPLYWVIDCYADRVECECAPADVAGTAPATSWRPVSESHVELQQEPVSERQITRLRNLRIETDTALLTRNQAQDLIRDAESKLTPTPKQLAKATALKVSVPGGATRGDVEDLIENTERVAAITSLRQHAIEIADGASWDDIEAAESKSQERAEAHKLVLALRRRGVFVTEGAALSTLYELESSRRDLDDALREAWNTGLVLAPPEQMTGEELQALSVSLTDFAQQFRMTETGLDHFVEQRWLPRRPRKSSVRAALPYMFERVRAGTWHGSIEDDLSFYRHALALEEEAGRDAKDLRAAPRQTTRNPASNPDSASSLDAPAMPRNTEPIKTPSFWRKLFGS
jgi:hypothetical protein